MEEKKKRRNRMGISLKYMEEFFVKHIGKIIMVVTLMSLLITNRYYCQMEIRKIDSLKKELKEVQLESLVISIELTGYSRRSLVEEQLKRQNIKLEEATTPPYELKK